MKKLAGTEAQRILRADWGHPLKGTCQEKKVLHKQEEAVFGGEDAAARMGPSLARRSSRHLIDSFASGPIYSQRFTEVSVFPY